MRLLGILILMSSIQVHAQLPGKEHEIVTNQVHIAKAPEWLQRNYVEKVINRVQTLLEWDIRKIEVYFHNDQAEFERFHKMGPSMIALSKKSDNSIHFGPRVDPGNFETTFGHELSHIISYQKYKGAIPAWIEEGLANYLGGMNRPDYKLLAKHPFPEDVRKLVHPGSGSADEIHFKYQTSQAVMEMIGKKCDLANLLRLSVGRKMENYLETYCGFTDLNASYRKWVKDHAPN